MAADAKKQMKSHLVFAVIPARVPPENWHCRH